MHRWLRYCLIKAGRRTGGQRYRLYAVAIKGGSVQAEGYNRPASDFPGVSFNQFAPTYIGLHAEMDCIRLATSESIAGSTLYVAGVNPSGGLLLSKPCDTCMETIIEAGIRKVVWHDTNGVGYDLRIRSR